MNTDKKIIEEKLKSLRNYATINNVPILREQTSELLKNKIKENNPQKILEIGTAVGYSGILMLSQSNTSSLITIEKDEIVAGIAEKNFEEVGLKARKEILIGDCIDILPNINQKFDFIFLDGPKGQYIKYLPHLLERLNNGGILFSDNVLYRGMVNGKTPIAKSKKTLVKNLKLFLEELDKNPVLEHTLLELEDGVSICKKIEG